MPIKHRNTNRNAARRDENEPVIVQALEAAGVTVWQMDGPVDLLCMSAGVYFWLEVKTPARRKDLEEQQREFLQLARHGHAPAYLVTTVHEALAARTDATQHRGIRISGDCRIERTAAHLATVQTIRRGVGQ